MSKNQAVRLITGAVKSTPISSLLLSTNNVDIKSEIRKSALKLHEKLISLPNIEYSPDNSHMERRLKTQEGSLQKSDYRYRKE